MTGKHGKDKKLSKEEHDEEQYKRLSKKSCSKLSKLLECIYESNKCAFDSFFENQSTSAFEVLAAALDAAASKYEVDIDFFLPNSVLIYSSLVLDRQSPPEPIVYSGILPELTQAAVNGEGCVIRRNAYWQEENPYNAFFAKALGKCKFLDGFLRVSRTVDLQEYSCLPCKDHKEHKEKKQHKDRKH
jgi:hypothetical protein